MFFFFPLLFHFLQKTVCRTTVHHFLFISMIAEGFGCTYLACREEEKNRRGKVQQGEAGVPQENELLPGVGMTASGRMPQLARRV